MSPPNFSTWFSGLTTHATPLDWQISLSLDESIVSRLIRIPTGLGKTEGVLGVWSYHRIERDDDTWPRRLIWCLPMRVLVEQTKQVAEALAARMPEDRRPDVFAAMGGEDAGDWYLYPEKPAIIVGTQDMLLSRALNRGYAAGRARWPIDYALLNQDALWVMDEVQLMDVGLVTSVQLQAFRDADMAQCLKPCHTWWMSATLQPNWLETVDFRDQLNAMVAASITIPGNERQGTVWEISKPLHVETISAKGKDAERLNQWSKLILDAHRNADCGESGRVTLVIVNRVEEAQAIHHKLQAEVGDDPDGLKLKLIHSRFRGIERKRWVARFLSRETCEDKTTNLIVVTTQVVEAGVDISASAMVTQLAPWPSLVQRFGRAARYRGTAEITVVDFQPDEKTAAPYELLDLEAAREALSQLDNVGLNSLEEFEDKLRTHEHAELPSRLYRYDYIHLLTRQEFDELFDTTPDLTGADLDISRFIRSGDERDVYVCWTNLDWEDAEKANPPASMQPLRHGLCPVPVYRAKKWLFAKGKLKDKCRAWAWSYMDSMWQPLKEDSCYPGQVVLVDAAFGGYDPQRGFTGERPKKGDPPIDVREGIENRTDTDLSDVGQVRDDRSKQAEWKTISTHGKEVAERVRYLSKKLALAPEIADVLELAALWHDLGKAHPAFQYNILIGDGDPPRDDFAKAPNWIDYRKKEFSHPEANREIAVEYGRRRGFRHELASVLALFELLARHNPDHDALLGPYRVLFEQGVLQPTAASEEGEPGGNHAIANCLNDLSAREFNLLVYLICCHHGKIRGAWQATPHDQRFAYKNPKLVGNGSPIRGVRDGDPLPSVELTLPDGQFASFPTVRLHLDPAAVGLSSRYGPSWTDRVHSLLDEFGPTTLAYLEALLRIADAHGSALETEDERIQQEAVS
ncbi:MAG: DEAD/DEAH box helicase [Candidatus Paceibacterota bacterium]